MPNPVTQSSQYSAQSINRYEVIFGTDFVSSGGLDTTRQFCEGLHLQNGTRVLDIGSGLGGSAFHMAERYGAHVTGVDILPQMVEEATRRATVRGIEHVRFVQGDILTVKLDDAPFDVAYSRDAILHIGDKPALFRRIHAMLAPGGHLFVTDYAHGANSRSSDFDAYVQDAGYHLLTLPAYAEVLNDTGFHDVVAMDETALFIETLRREIASIRGGDHGLNRADRDYLLQRWEKKIVFCESGEMCWARLEAKA